MNTKRAHLMVRMRLAMCILIILGSIVAIIGSACSSCHFCTRSFLLKLDITICMMRNCEPNETIPDLIRQSELYVELEVQFVYLTQVLLLLPFSSWVVCLPVTTSPHFKVTRPLNRVTCSFTLVITRVRQTQKY